MIECLKMHKENFDYCLGELIRESEEKDKEIERLNNIIKEIRYQLQQKENIIKEVREYITYWHYRNDFRINSFTTGVKEELLEILDKESE